jgi:hypothetical protein
MNFRRFAGVAKRDFPDARTVNPALAKAAHYRGLGLVQQLKTGANRDTGKAALEL